MHSTVQWHRPCIERGSPSSNECNQTRVVFSGAAVLGHRQPPHPQRVSEQSKSKVKDTFATKQRRKSFLEEDKGDADDEIEFLYEQNFQELRAQALKNNTLFEDTAEFPADNDLLRTRSTRHVEDLEWLRPHEFVRPDEPVLVSERNEGFDIRVGLDSWFVPAMGAIAESEALLNQVRKQQL